MFIILISILIGCSKANEDVLFPNSFLSEAKEKYLKLLKNNQNLNYVNRIFYWNKSFQSNIESLEILEVPVKESVTKTLIPSIEKLNQEEKIKIANAAINRITFIKSRNLDIDIRQTIYVPTYEYLKSKGFDINNVSILSKEWDFSGQVIVKDLSGEILSIGLYNRGIKYKSIKIGATEGLNSKMSQLPSTNDDLWECEIVTICDVISYNSGRETWENCRNEFTGNCWPSSIVIDDQCSSLSSEICICKMYNLECNKNGGGKFEQTSCSQSKIEESTKFLDNLVEDLRISNEVESVSDLYENSQKRNRHYSWTCIKGKFSEWKSYEESQQFLDSDMNWSFKSLVHKDITMKTYYPNLDGHINAKNFISTLGRYHARIDFDAEVYYTLALLNCPVVKSRTSELHCTNIFNINDGQ